MQGHGGRNHRQRWLGNVATLNRHGAIDVFDIVGLIDVEFGGKPLPNLPEIADVDFSLAPDVFDVIYLIECTFNGGAPPCV